MTTADIDPGRARDVIETGRASLGIEFGSTNIKACLIGPDGILATYRKTHPWIPWEVHTSPHDLLPLGYDRELFPVAETELGRIGVATCYDWLFPEAIRQLAWLALLQRGARRG